MFQLSKSSPIEVFDNYVVCDGHSVEDLQGITIPKMQLYTGIPSEDDQYLFIESCFKAGGQVRPIEREAEYTTITEPSSIGSVSFDPEPVAYLPGTDTLADREIVLPKTDLAIEVDGEIVYDEKKERKKMTIEERKEFHSKKMKAYWADRKLKGI